MLWAIIVILAILSAVLLFFCLVQRHDIRVLTDDLRRTNSLGGRLRLNLPSPGKDTQALVHEINQVIDGKSVAMEEYERSDRELRTAIANISHDLRTPLTSIMGYLQLMEGEGIPDEERAAYLKVVKNRTESLQTLISLFYDLSRLQAGEYPMSETILPLAPAVYEILAAYYNDFEDRGLRVEIGMPEELPPVSADEDALLRVLGNLIQNVLRHGKSYVGVSARAEETEVVLSFTNDTVGLTEEDVEQLFDRFFTADRMRTGRNTGLGLSIVKMLMEQMGGGVRADLQGDLLTISARFLRGE